MIVLLAGTNNVGASRAATPEIADIARGVKAIVDLCRQKAPDATIVLTGIFPRNDNMAVMPTINEINASSPHSPTARRSASSTSTTGWPTRTGRLLEGVINERDKLHPTLKGYQIWADALKPIFRELLGPPAATDLAPPPTGDPSAASDRPAKDRATLR